MQIIMPKLGLTMTHGTIVEWLKAPGDAVEAEEVLCTYETEKVTLELPSPEHGVLAEILVPSGETVAAGTPLCVVETGDGGRRTEDEGPKPKDVGRPAATPALAVPGFAGYASVSGQRSAPRGPVIASPKARSLARQLGVDLAGISGRGPGGRMQAADVSDMGARLAPARSAEVKATPLARRIAAAAGLDLRPIPGTGTDGTITREDVEAAIRDQGSGIRSQRSGISGQPPVASATQEETVVPLTTLRRIVGQRMTQSAFTAPHVTLMTEAEATNLVSARTQLNEELALNASNASKARGTSSGKISFNTLFAALVARALREQPQLNSRLEPEGIHLHAHINIALAVDTERGLVTPVLRDVDQLAVPSIQRGYDALIERAATGKSLPDDFEGGTFTITNLGALDVDGFTPIINPPQAAILGVGRIVEKPVSREGAVVVRPMVTLSLSFDHRIVDGGPAARFLQRVKQLVERPMALLV